MKIKLTADEILYSKTGWNEADHPRDANGRFGSGGGRTSTTTTPRTTTTPPDTSESRKKINEQIEKFANHKRTSSTESALVLDRNGNQLFSKAGTINSVEFSSTELSLMKDTIVLSQWNSQASSVTRLIPKL